MAHFVKTEEEVELCEEGGDPEIHAAEGELVVWVFFSFFHIWWAFSVGRDNISCPGRPGDAII